jgi:hypothetical protein
VSPGISARRALRFSFGRTVLKEALKTWAIRADSSPVRGTRALVGSLGAGLSLAVAGSLALLVVSTVVAFRGWPDDLGSSAPVSVSRLAPAAETVAPHALPRATARVLALPAVTAVPVVHRGAAGGTRNSGATTKTNSPTTSAPVSVTSPGSTPSTSSAPVSETGGRVTPSLKRTTTAAGDVVRQTTKQTADTVAPVAPAAGKVVEDVGSTAGDVVDKGGNAVAEALGHLGQ